MSENPSDPTGPLDVRSIHQLVKLMKRYDMTAIDLIDGTTRIRLRRRGPEPIQAVPVYAPPPQAPVAAAATATSAAASAPASAPSPAASSDMVIESPMVGTYYASPAPDAPPFVGVGSAVRSDTTIGVIEAMKVFTEIPAGMTGTVTEVLVKNGQPVEFGQPLFRVRPS